MIPKLKREILNQWYARLWGLAGIPYRRRKYMLQFHTVRIYGGPVIERKQMLREGLQLLV